MSACLTLGKSQKGKNKDTWSQSLCVDSLRAVRAKRKSDSLETARKRADSLDLIKVRREADSLEFSAQCLAALNGNHGKRTDDDWKNIRHCTDSLLAKKDKHTADSIAKHKHREDSLRIAREKQIADSLAALKHLEDSLRMAREKFTLDSLQNLKRIQDSLSTLDSLRRMAEKRTADSLRAIREKAIADSILAFQRYTDSVERARAEQYLIDKANEDKICGDVGALMDRYLGDGSLIVRRHDDSTSLILIDRVRIGTNICVDWRPLFDRSITDTLLFTTRSSGLVELAILNTKTSSKPTTDLYEVIGNHSNEILAKINLYVATRKQAGLY